MKIIKDATQFIGGYQLDLYCRWANAEHNYREFPHIYTGEYGNRVRSEARKDGWTLHKNGTATCPVCNKKLKEKKQ